MKPLSNAKEKRWQDGNESKQGREEENTVGSWDKKMKMKGEGKKIWEDRKRCRFDW